MLAITRQDTMLSDMDTDDVEPMDVHSPVDVVRRGRAASKPQPQQVHTGGISRARTASVPMPFTRSRLELSPAVIDPEPRTDRTSPARSRSPARLARRPSRSLPRSRSSSPRRAESPARARPPQERALVTEGGGHGEKGTRLHATAPRTRVLRAALVGMLAYGWLAFAPEVLGGRAATAVNALLCVLAYLTQR